MKIKAKFGILLTVMIVAMFAAISANAAYVTQEKITKIPEPGENNAYITMTAEPKSNMMTYLGGEHLDKNDELYSEPATFAGIEGRQVWKQNIFYLKVDPEFADPTDCVFAIIVDYWDYGGRGYYHVEYTPQDMTETKRVTIEKQGTYGPNGGNNTEIQDWWRTTIYVSDAQFANRYENGGDLRIYTGAFNTFAHVEVVNLSRYAKDSTDYFGVVNQTKARVLSDNGLYPWDGTDESLNREYTREETLVDIVKLFAPDKVMKRTTTAFTDVKAENQPYLATAQKLGLIQKTVSPTVLGADEKITQDEMVRMFVAYVGKDASTPDIYTYARELNLIIGDSMIFQMKKNATMDNFVSLAVAALTTEIDGKTPILDMIDSGVVDIAVAYQDSFMRDIIERKPFKLEPNVVIDHETGRTWYWIDLFGIRVEKGYMAQNQFSTDNKRFYFIDEHKRVYEYDTETHYCTFIDKGYDPWNYIVVTTETNHVVYVNTKKEIVKMDCDTHEKKVVAKIPAQYNNASLFHITRDGRYMSIEGRDGSLDVKRETRFAVVDLETGEWDLRYYHGFDSPMYYPDHLMINPVNPRYMIFVHDTDATAIERVWLLDRETGERWHAIPHHKIEDEGFTGVKSYETMGHESWCPDGEYILVNSTGPYLHASMTVSYSADGVNTAGYLIQRWDGKDRTFVPNYTGNGCNHPGIGFTSRRWIVGDGPSNNQPQLMKVTDSFSGINYRIVTIPGNNQNPCHAHPAFSWDDTKILFGLTHPDGPASHSCIGWSDVTDIVTNPVDGGKHPLGNGVETFSYEETENFMYVEEDEEGTYYRVPVNCHMPILVMPDHIDEANLDVTVSITYKDDSKNPIKLAYYTFKKIGRINRPEKHYYEIERNDTGKWKTIDIKLEGVGVDNMGDLGKDFDLIPVASGMEIRSVEVTKTEK